MSSFSSLLSSSPHPFFLSSTERSNNPITPPMEVKGDTRSCMLDHHQQKMGTGVGFMECSICLDAPAEPVVTMCGHLYCWPCIYKWMQHAGGEKGAAAAGCPVCKSHLSEHSFIPLYGRGSNRRNSSSMIPDRPSPRLMVDSSAQQQRRRRPGYQYDDGGYMASASVLHSTAGGVLCGVAEAVMPWVSGNHEGRMYQYHSSPYVIGVSGSSRMRMMRIESSLSQIWGFLLCFAILCFIFF